MAWLPGAIRKEVTRHRTPIELIGGQYRGVVYHIAASEGASLFNYFNQPGNPTSHFYVRYDGTVEQYVDTRYRAPAQLDGNPTLISIETQGGTADTPNQPNSCDQQQWTTSQREALAQITAWLHGINGMPLIPMTSSRSESRGVGYHRLGVDPYRVNGGERWSTAYGKACPCEDRIMSIPGIITRAQAIAEGDMPLTQQDVDAVVAGVWGKLMGDVPASTIMVRLNPGTDGMDASIREESWNKQTTSTIDGSAISVLDLLRQVHGDTKITRQSMPSAEQIAAAVWAAAPPGGTGDLTFDDIVNAVKKAFREGSETP